MISMNCRPPRAAAAIRPAALPGGEGSDAEQRELEHRLGHPAFDQDERDQQAVPPTIEAITAGFVQPMAWPP